MALTPKRKMTEKNLAAHRRNGPQSRGAVTPEGKGRAARANLRHGFYAQQAPAVLTSLGEDPADYDRLVQSLENNLAGGLEGELVRRILRTLWMMQCAERMQDGVALKRVQTGLLMEDVLLAPRLLETEEIYERLCALCRVLNGPHPLLSAAQIRAFENGFGAAPAEAIQNLFPLLRTYGQLTAQAAEAVNENAGGESTPTLDPQQEAARRELMAATEAVVIPYSHVRERQRTECDSIRTSENIAALMAPKEDALLMQRMDDANLRRLWRLTNILFKIRNGALA